MIINSIKNTFNLIKLKKLNNKKASVDYVIMIVLALIILMIVLYLIFNWSKLADKFSGRLSNLGGHKYD